MPLEQITTARNSPVASALLYAEESFRRIVAGSFPFFYDLKVNKECGNADADRMWSFSTDNRTINMLVYDEDMVNRKFDDLVVPFYKGLGLYADETGLKEKLLRDNFLYLFFHELGHPKDCPNSKDEEKKIDQVIFQALKEKGSTDAEAVQKTSNVRNLVWDLVVDTMFYCDSQGILDQKTRNKYSDFPDSIVPLFDVIECEKPGSTLFPLSRLIYGSLFSKKKEARRKFVKHFSKAVGGIVDIQSTFNEMYTGFVSEFKDEELKGYSISKEGFKQALKGYYGSLDDDKHSYLVKAVGTLLSSKETRYKAINGFVKAICKYISNEKKDGRPCGEGGGGASSALENLIDQVSNPDDLIGDLANGKSEVSIEAADRFYNRHKTHINFRSLENPDLEIRARESHFDLLETRLVTEQELMQFDLHSIINFQESTGLPSILEVGQGLYQLNFYEQKEDILYGPKAADIHLYDNVVFIVDSSSSMYTDSFVGNKKRYDMTSRVIYSLMDGMSKASKKANKKVDVGIVNFSDETNWSGFSDVNTVVAGYDNGFKRSLLSPQGGFTVLDTKVLEGIKTDKKTCYVMLSDGDLSNDSVQWVRGLAKNDSHLVYVDIGNDSSYRRMLNGMKNVTTYKVNSVEEIAQELGNILVPA